MKSKVVRFLAQINKFECIFPVKIANAPLIHNPARLSHARTSSLMRRCFSMFVFSSSAARALSLSTELFRSSRSVSQWEERLRWFVSSCCSFSCASDSWRQKTGENSVNTATVYMLVSSHESEGNTQVEIIVIPYVPYDAECAMCMST